LRALDSGWVEEQMHGIASLFLVRRLAQEMEKDWPAVLGKLEAIRQILVNRQAMLCNVTLDATNWDKFLPELGDFLGELPSTTPAHAAWRPTSAASFEGLAIPAQVNYVGKGANLYDLGYSVDGSVEVIPVRTTWL
jgi:Zn-dependent M16 (insulinase) family peptidase